MLSSNISAAEWKEAEKFFKKNPQQTKFEKKDTQESSHSFIKIAESIYAINNTRQNEPDAGKGGYARVKQAINKKGEKIVIKVESKKYKEMEDTREVDQLMKDAGYLLDRKEQHLKSDNKRRIKVKNKNIEGVEVKIYTAFEYRGDRNLEEEIHKNPHAATPPANLVLALKALQGIEALHRKKIVHADIKLDNFMVNGENENLTVKPIDFDLSAKIMKDGKTLDSTKTVREDTRQLGFLLQDLGLPKALYEPLKRPIDQRMSIVEAIELIKQELNKKEYAEDPMVKSALQKKQSLWSKLYSTAKNTHIKPKHAIALASGPTGIAAYFALRSQKADENELGKDLKEKLEKLESKIQKDADENKSSNKGDSQQSQKFTIPNITTSYQTAKNAIHRKTSSDKPETSPDVSYRIHKKY